MSSIRFYPYSSNHNSKIYIRLILRREQDFRLSTGLTIQNPSHWSSSTHFPKKNNAENKALHNSLKDLESHIEKELLKVEQSQDESLADITSKWLKSIIKDFFNEVEITEKDLLIPFAESFAKSLHHRTYQRGAVQNRYSKKTIDKYKNFARQLREYQTHINKSLKLTDVDKDFADGFLQYLSEEKGLAINTIGRYIKRLKTIAKEAEEQGLRINVNYKAIKGFEDENIVTFLTFEDIDLIVETDMPNERLQLAKEWLIIGCYTAQRISDMFRMKKSMIITKNNIDFITLKQFKTKKQVMIPIHYRVKAILKKYDSDFPPNFSKVEQSHRSTLGTLMKEVCKISGIIEPVFGRFNGIKGTYPKYKLISNHSCRRSFCSNFYGQEGWTNQIIMEISGHETEKNFLKYIDKESFHLSEQAGALFAQMEKDDLTERKKLRVLKSATN